MMTSPPSLALLLLASSSSSAAAAAAASAASSSFSAPSAFVSSPGARSMAAMPPSSRGRARHPFGSSVRRVRPPSRALEMKHTLVLVRHGESTWNKENLFTGWVDVPLSVEGEEEAVAGGKLLRDAGYTFDLAYTSTLKRAIKTLWIVLEEMDLMYIPIVNTWRLNERHYGALQGLNKQETVDEHGKEQVLIWRRSYDVPPPPVDRDSVHHPGNDPRYEGEDFPDEFTESLESTARRFMPDWEDVISPRIMEGRKVLIAAHGNTLRALVQHLDGISVEEICDLNIPTGVPLVYELDDDLNVIPHPDAIPPLQGHYLGDQEEVRERIGAVMEQTK